MILNTFVHDTDSPAPNSSMTLIPQYPFVHDTDSPVPGHFLAI